MTRHTGPLLIAFASFLWGTDALFRYPISEAIDPTFIVFCEHLLGTILLLFWVVAKHGKQAFKLTKPAWVAAVFVGAGGSAVATALFTASFRYVNPSVAILLQKLQPVLVVVIAYVILKERPGRQFIFWAPVALGAAIVLSFPDLKFNFTDAPRRTHGVIYAATAALIWSATTVVGKILLKRTSPSVATFWRYAFGLLTLSLLLAISHVPFSANVAVAKPVWSSLFYLAIFAGILPMAIYYSGLKKTTASVTTFVELLFPVSAVILNTVFLNMPLSVTQLAAGAVLLFAVTRISA